VGRVIHFQDLTELRSMEGAVRRSERLAGIGRLAANIAHEIRNPLASISGSVEVLRKQPGTDAEARTLIDIAVREVDRVNGLISGLLDYARPRTEDRQRLDLGEMVTEIAKVFEQERRSAEVGVVVDAEPVWLSRARPDSCAKCCGTSCATPSPPCRGVVVCGSRFRVATEPTARPRPFSR